MCHCKNIIRKYIDAKTYKKKQNKKKQKKHWAPKLWTHNCSLLNETLRKEKDTISKTLHLTDTSVEIPK